MNSHYLGDEANLIDLESRINAADRIAYESFKFLRIESGFLERIFVIYKPTGLTREGLHRDPEVLGQVRVTGFAADSRSGCVMSLENMETGEAQKVGHIPTRLFNFDIFIGVPPFHRLRWDARPFKGEVKRSLAFGVLVKQRTRSDHFSAGATMLETPAKFRTFYPNYDLQLQYR